MTVAIFPVKNVSGVGTIATDADVAEFSKKCLQTMPFDEMVDTQFRTDAHYVSYSVKGLDNWPRLRKGIELELREAGMEVSLNYFSFDWDNAGHSKWDAASIKLFEEVLTMMGTHPVLSLWHTMYATKHGARIVYKPDTPVPIEVAEEHYIWLMEQFKLGGFDVGTKLPGGHIDAQCSDWTRCMKCPQVLHSDGTQTWTQSYYRLFKQKKILPNKLLGRLNQKTLPRTKTFNKKQYTGKPVPSHADSLTQLQAVVNGKMIWTDFYKRARKVLKNSYYFDIIFNNAATGWDRGGRNDSVLKMIGIITPILLKNCYASINQIFALLYSPLLTLGTDQDWPAHAWNALLDIYGRENDKHNIEKEKIAERARIELNHLDNIVEGMKEWHDHPDLFADEETAREFARARCLASFGSYFFTIDKDGYYCPSSMGTSQVISRIRKSGHLSDIVPTTKPSITGEEIDLTPATIQNSYSTSICEIQMKPVGNKGGYIVDMDGEKPKLILSCFSRNDDLIPVYNVEVDGWLRALGGEENHEKLCQWIGNALAFEKGLICALSLEGASNCGKKMLTSGLAECLKDPITAGPMDIYDKSSAFTKTPFLVVNEAWPEHRGAGLSPADTFKSILGGDGVRVREMFKPAIWVLNPIRMILTANDDGIIQTLTKDKDMNPENRKAIGERLFHFRAGPADKYLKSLGGMGFTAKEGARWIRPDSGAGDGDFVVAKHFMWLYKNRDEPDPSNRFLVMGNSAPGCGGSDMTVFEKQLTDNKRTPTVATAIIQMVDHKATNVWGSGYLICEDTGQLFVTRNGVHKYIRDGMSDNRISERDIFSAMTNIIANTEPEKDELGYSWYEIDVETLLMAASEWGLECDTIRRLADTKRGLKL